MTACRGSGVRSGASGGDGRGRRVPASSALVVVEFVLSSSEQTDKCAGKQQEDDGEDTQELFQVCQLASRMGKSREEGIIASLMIQQRSGLLVRRRTRIGHDGDGVNEKRSEVMES